ncbi:MAG: hypothetical protein QNJ40_23355 [Xanthomonadales bacterium]|nr:hypothetical protein [Xanthomonadales bacterium]
MNAIDLKREERNAFRSVTDTGLRDMMIASFVAMFAIAPLLSGTLGDFWSSAVFLPVLAVVYLIIRFVHSRLIVPRVGQAQWSAVRKSHLRRLGVAMLVVNVAAFISGAVAFFLAERGVTGPWLFSVPLSLIVMVLFSLLAYAMSVPRYFVYGVALAACLPVGEWLFQQGYASHHGFPMVFGSAAIAIALIGLVKFVRIASQPIPAEDG